jgi:hypothetical protein
VRVDNCRSAELKEESSLTIAGAAGSADPASAPLSVLDAGAMLLSALCLVHCLALPLVVAVLPWAVAGVLSSESFHLWMLVAVVPSSAVALLLGCRRHRDWRVLGVGSAGVLLLAVAVIGVYVNDLSHHGETLLTVAGAVLTALAHAANFMLHRRAHPGHRHGSGASAGAR